MKMVTKRFISSLCLCVAFIAVCAQEDRHVELNEVTVKSSRIINKADGQIIYPTKEQKVTSPSAYSLLQKIALPEIRIDEMSQSITALNNNGNVQVRINGIEATADELSRVNCNDVDKIEFTDRPGVRYGDDVGYVINIILRRSIGGFSIGAQLMEALTTEYGRNSLFGKINKGNSQWEMSYGFSHSNVDAAKLFSVADYIMPDNTVHRFTRADSDCRQRNGGHNMQLIYNLADSAKYTFQVKLTGMMSRIPQACQQRNITDNDTPAYVAERQTSDRTLSPAADIYYNLKTGKNQSLTLNALLTYISSDYHYADTEGSAYRYSADGKSWSSAGEAIYENRLRPFTLSAGIRYRYKKTDNLYTGDIAARDMSHTQTIYAFGELKGMSGKLGYTAGAGVSHLDFSHNTGGYNYWLFRPKAQLSYPVIRNLRLSYDFQISQHVSGIANTSNAAIRINSMEIEKGNPDLQPNRVTEHSIRLGYSAPQLQAHALLYVKLNDNCNMGKYIRETDVDGNTMFIHTQTNQKSIDLVMTQGYLNYYIIPEKLNLSVTGSMYRCINHGDDYRHYYTAFNGSASITAYLGKLTLSAYADNGFRWMEGETRGHQGGYSMLSATYGKGNVSMSLRWQNPLRHEDKQLTAELMNRYISKSSVYTNRDMANLVNLNINWTMNYGRKYKDIKRKTNTIDTDSGIMKNK